MRADSIKPKLSNGFADSTSDSISGLIAGYPMCTINALIQTECVLMLFANSTMTNQHSA